MTSCEKNRVQVCMQGGGRSDARPLVIRLFGVCAQNSKRHKKYPCLHISVPTSRAQTERLTIGQTYSTCSDVGMPNCTLVNTLWAELLPVRVPAPPALYYTPHRHKARHCNDSDAAQFCELRSVAGTAQDAHKTICHWFSQPSQEPYTTPAHSPLTHSLTHPGFYLVRVVHQSVHFQ